MTDALAGFRGDGPIVVDHHVPTGTPDRAVTISGNGHAQATDEAPPITGQKSFIAGFGLPQAQVRP